MQKEEKEGRDGEEGKVGSRHGKHGEENACVRSTGPIRKKHNGSQSAPRILANIRAVPVCIVGWEGVSSVLKAGRKGQSVTFYDLCARWPGTPRAARCPSLPNANSCHPRGACRDL